LLLVYEDDLTELKIQDAEKLLQLAELGLEYLSKQKTI